MTAGCWERKSYKVETGWIFATFDRATSTGASGWYSWKPFVILHALDRATIQWLQNRRRADPPIILWTDADTYPIADLTPLYEQCREGRRHNAVAAAEGCVQGAWTKRSCTKAMACGHGGLPAIPARRGQVPCCSEAGNYRAEEQFLMEWQT